MAKNVNGVLPCRISQEARVPIVEVNQGASVCAWAIQRAELGVRDTDQKTPILVNLSSQQRQKLQQARLLKELKADTAAIWFSWPVCLGNGSRQRRLRLVSFCVGGS